MEKHTVSASLTDNTKYMNRALPVKKSFDIIERTLIIGGQNSAFYFIDGFTKDEIILKLMDSFLNISADDMPEDATSFSTSCIPYVEVDILGDFDSIFKNLLSGVTCLFIDGYEAAIAIDCRTYPSRSIEEPDKDKSLRGSRDGFVETIVFNTALMRRRIRDPHLIMEMYEAGTSTRTDVALCYMSDRVDRELLTTIQNKLEESKSQDLKMSQQSLAEALFQRKWYNPFPKVRYSERPDAAAASILEGNIVILVDNSPSAMVLPTSIFDFIQDTNDYYFPPLIGTYLRTVRIIVFLLTLILTPTWYLLECNPQWIPEWLGFIRIEEPNGVPIVAQLLLIEFIIDGLKLASLNTPSVLSNSFSVVGALVLGDFAVQAKWFVPEVVLFMAFVSIANFTQPSFELGYAFKLFRVLILILTAIWNVWGYIAGLVLMFVVLISSKTISGRGYLYPVIPFNAQALSRLLVRRRISNHNT